MRLLELFFRVLSLFLFLVAIERPAKADPVDAVNGVMGAVGLATNLLGGIFGKKSATAASQLQQAAAAKAAQGVTDATNAANPNILNAAGQAGGDVVDTSNTAADNAKRAALSANDHLAQYADAGSAANQYLSGQLQPGGAFNKTPTMADITIDPGYAFRESEAQKAIQASAAAQGGFSSGGVLKALTDRSSSDASQEYANAYARFQQNTQNRFNNLLSVSDQGQSAATTQGNNLTNEAQYAGNAQINAANYQGNAAQNAANLTSQNSINAANSAGNYLTQGANAAAAGQVAGTNALWGGINGGVGAASTALQIGQLLKNPSNLFTGTARPAYSTANP